MTPADSRWYLEYTQRQRKRRYISAFFCLAFTLAIAYVGLAIAEMMK